MITRADVQAAIDVVRQLTDEIDDITDVKLGIELTTEIAALQKQAKLCHELLEARTVTALDGQPAQVGGKVYVASASTTGKWRPDQQAIRRAIRECAITEATNLETGEVRPRVAVDRAMELLAMGYVSPSKMPNQGLLKELGISNKEIATYERGRKRLTSMDVEKEIDDE